MEKIFISTNSGEIVAFLKHNSISYVYLVANQKLYNFTGTQIVFENDGAKIYKVE